MAKLKTLPAPPPATKFKETDATTWEGLQVFPAALDGKGGELREKSLKKLAKIGIANLRFVCQTAVIPYPAKAGSTALAMQLFAAAPANTMAYLLDFAKRREQSILEQYEAEFSDKERNQYEGEIDDLSEQRPEGPRTFTKLLLM